MIKVKVQVRKQDGSHVRYFDWVTHSADAILAALNKFGVGCKVEVKAVSSQPTYWRGLNHE